ncbi:MAG: HAMP domain-containing sensor histidine kinase [Caldilineaceae bacterium]
MMHSLRMRLALSHTLPILIFVPLLGLVLLYQLEQRFFLNYMARELAVQGALIAEFPRTDPRIWNDPVLATGLINTLQQSVPAQMSFVDEATLLAAINADTASAASGQTNPQAELGASLLARASRGQVVWTIDNGAATADRTINVAVPVLGGNGKVVGAVRLAQRLTDVQERINGLRVVVLATLFVGAILSLLLGLVLARSLGAPLLRLSQAVASFQPTDQPEQVPETGPTEMKSLAANFNRMSERLHELERTRTLLLSGIVHELGRPLGSIKAAAQTVEANADVELSHELAGGISEHVDRLRLQLEDLALLGEIEVQGLTLHPEPLALTDLIADVCHQFQEMAVRNAITLSCRVTDLPPIEADPRRIEQILGNLLHNACKYTPAGGCVAVTAGVESQACPPLLWVDVTDSGPGIPAGEEERIFHFFYRNPNLRRIHQGMGIGLALSRQLAAAHGGSLTVAHRPGPGATFRLRLPLGEF